MPAYTITPQDILFFRDGRPIETGGGHGARWPEPSVIFDAIHAALWRAFPAPQHWEHRHDFGRSSNRPMKGDTQRFGALVTAGLFPVWKDGRWLFPAPADAIPVNTADWLLMPFDLAGGLCRSNLPAPLRYPVGNFAGPTKQTTPQWWSAAAWKAYFSGKPPDRSEQFANEELFSAEWTTGIGIDPKTQTQDGQHIYSAEYLRLRPGVRCGFLASLMMKQNSQPAGIHECIGKLFVANNTIVVGGQQRPCRVEPCELSQIPLPVGASITGTRVKWVLLTPAIWPEIREQRQKGIAPHPGGWLPNWVAPYDNFPVLRGSQIEQVQAGRVLLKADPSRQPGGSREAWRKHIREAPFLNCRLVAAVIPRPIPITGWTERLHLLRDEENIWMNGGTGSGPRVTHLAVPAGAVYYFEANSPEAAAQLAAALNWHGSEANPTTIRNRRSTLLGEKGFGLGVCGSWEFYRSDRSDLTQPDKETTP